MEIDLDTLSANQVYHAMIRTVIPRPIAWVLSENAGGNYNLAPFSYFNGVCSDPPLIMISVGKKPDGTPKDTRVNIEERRDFVVHIAHEELLESLNQSSASLPAGESEVDLLGLPLTPMAGSRLPRLADARIALACELFQLQEIGASSQALILGRVKRIYIDDGACSRDDEGRLVVDAERIAPVTRLGGTEYATFGKIRRLPRPR
jgi:flavin reductase (DIM6/NTAB) family NADH-FMN oxidoreductase RutF